MLRGLDLFHQMVKLRYNGSDRFTTNTGCFFTICVVFITLAISIATFKSILGFESPQVTVERSILPIPNPTSLSAPEFNFAVKLPKLDEASSLITLTMLRYTAIQHNNGTVEEILAPFPYKKCTIDYMKNYSEAFTTLGLEEAFCPDDNDLRISGIYHNPMTESLILSISSCQNDTNRPEIVCKSKEEILEFFANGFEGFVELFYSNTLISPTVHSEPVSYYLDNNYWFLLPGVQTIDAEVYINQQEILTDDNFLLEGWNVKNQTTYNVDATEMKTRPRSLMTIGENTFGIINIWLTKSTYKYTTKRLYPKLQEGLASVGSVFSLCVVVFGIIAGMYTENAYSLHFASQLYDLEYPRPQDKKKKRENGAKKDAKPQKSRCKRRRNRANTNHKTVEPPGANKSEAQEDSTALRSKNLFDKKQAIHYHLGDFLLGFFPCFRRKKDILIKKVIEAAEREFDLVEIVKRLHEFDRLKKILLEEDELMMLSYLKRPVISVQDPPPKSRGKSSRKAKKNKNLGDQELESGIKLKQETDSSTENSRKSPGSSKKEAELDKFADSFQNYNRLLKKMKHSVVSRKILKHMDPQISDVLFDYGVEINSNEKLKKATPQKIKANGDASAKSQNPRTMSKIEAGMIIASKLKKNYLLRKKQKLKEPAKLAIQINEQSVINHDMGEDYSITSEKPLIRPQAQEFEKIRKFEEQSHVAMKSIQTNQSPTLDHETTRVQIGPHENTRVDIEIPNIVVNQGQDNDRPLPTSTAPRTIGNESYFNLIIGSSMK